MNFISPVTLFYCVQKKKQFHCFYDNRVLSSIEIEQMKVFEEWYMIYQYTLQVKQYQYHVYNKMQYYETYLMMYHVNW